MIFRYVKPSAVQNWISVNAAGSLKDRPGDSWRAYMLANGGSGQSFHDLEMTFLNAAGFTTGQIGTRWQNYLAANGGGTGDARAKFQAKYK